ncbi:hypothetical protein ACIQNU_39445 [Streptomyces sp. NPDC091292]|uniref:hypothetical protein n=1 Tax=Streptomyces sp. NPDC091292 TaxID=3365991 RepID=UPI003800145E
MNNSNNCPSTFHGFNGYRTCYYPAFGMGGAISVQRDAYTRAREWMDSPIGMVRTGVTTDQVRA